jgi:hypothetical protein
VIHHFLIDWDTNLSDESSRLVYLDWDTLLASEADILSRELHMTIVIRTVYTTWKSRAQGLCFLIIRPTDPGVMFGIKR